MKHIIILLALMVFISCDLRILETKPDPKGTMVNVDSPHNKPYDDSLMIYRVEGRDSVFKVLNGGVNYNSVDTTITSVRFDTIHIHDTIYIKK